MDYSIRRALVRVNRRSDIPNLLHALDAERVCEVGVRNGDHLRELLVVPASEFVAVDIWCETGVRAQNDECFSQDELDKQYRRVAELDPRVHVDRSLSVVAATHYRDGYFDFVYLDADHTYVAVLADLVAWWPKVRAGGVMAGHDYCPASPVCADGVRVAFGVIEAVNAFAASEHLALHVDADSDWFIAKPAKQIPLVLTNRPGRATLATCRAAHASHRP